MIIAFRMPTKEIEQFMAQRITRLAARPGGLITSVSIEHELIDEAVEHPLYTQQTRKSAERHSHHRYMKKMIPRWRGKRNGKKPRTSRDYN